MAMEESSTGATGSIANQPQSTLGNEMRLIMVLVLSLQLLAGLLSACGPSEEDQNATVTKISADLFATQTAGAPTPTPDPTETPTPTATAEPTPTQEPTPTPVLPDPLQLLETALDALETAESYRMVSDAAMSLDLRGIQLEFDLVSDIVSQPPDRGQGSITTEILGETTVQELIVIDDMVYQTDPETGRWQSERDPMGAMDLEGIARYGTDVQDLVLVSEELLDGQPVYYLQAVKSNLDEVLGTLLPPELMTQLAGTGFSIEVYGEIAIDYWINIADGRLVKNSSVGEIEMVVTDPSGGEEPVEMIVGMDSTTLYSDYDEPVQIEAPEVQTAKLLSTPFGQMIRYEADQFPFSILYPADWQIQQAAFGETARFASISGDLLVITVEDLVVQGLGAMTLEEYTDLVISTIDDSFQVEVASREQLTTQQGEAVEMVSFVIEGNLYKGFRFIYILEDRVAFNATYVVDESRFEELRPLLDYSFTTFWSGEELEKITVWHGWGGSYFDEIETIFSEYEIANDMKVELSQIYIQGEVLVDLDQAVQTGNGPDILAWWVSGAMEGNITPITDWIDQDHQFDNFEPAAADASIWQGEVWSIPLSQEGIAIVYNKELVSEDDLPDDPTDFDGLLKSAVEFREANPDKYLLCNQGIGSDSFDTYHVAPVYFGFGGDDELGFIDGDGNVHLNTPERLAAAEWLLEFSGVAPERTSHVICLEGMKNGTFAAWWTGPWAIADLEAAGIDYGILPFGRPFMSIKRLMMGTNAVDRGHEEVVIELLQLFGSPEVQARLALINGTIPANSEALNDPEVQQIYSIGAFGQAIRMGIPIGNSLYPDVQWDPIAKMTGAIIRGELTPEEALAETQAEIESIIEGLSSP